MAGGNGPGAEAAVAQGDLPAVAAGPPGAFAAQAVVELGEGKCDI